ncbi:hypothetical protein B0O99DRAFT_621329 [Bisporella sp. PMI_857]|nr:hypothetical protein B0O99DRAFT_621329 [Bisporella sp. PMI_857]
MQFSLVAKAVALMMASEAMALALPANLSNRQLVSSYTTEPASLLIGACMSIGTCRYGSDPNIQACYTRGCQTDNLGGVCSNSPPIPLHLHIQLSISDFAPANSDPSQVVLSKSRISSSKKRHMGKRSGR